MPITPKTVLMLDDAENPQATDIAYLIQGGELNRDRKATLAQLASVPQERPAITRDALDTNMRMLNMVYKAIGSSGNGNAQHIALSVLAQIVGAPMLFVLDSSFDIDLSGSYRTEGPWSGDVIIVIPSTLPTTQNFFTVTGDYPKGRRITVINSGWSPVSATNSSPGYCLMKNSGFDQQIYSGYRTELLLSPTDASIVEINRIVSGESVWLHNLESKWARVHFGYHSGETPIEADPGVTHVVEMTRLPYNSFPAFRIDLDFESNLDGTASMVALVYSGSNLLFNLSTKVGGVSVCSKSLVFETCMPLDPEFNGINSQELSVRFRLDNGTWGTTNSLNNVRMTATAVSGKNYLSDWE